MGKYKNYEEEKALFKNVNNYFVLAFVISFLSIVCLSIFSYKVIYHQSIKETFHSLENAIKTESNKVNMITGAYASWNLTYENIVDQLNPAWITNNIVDDAKQNFSIPYVTIFDDNKEFTTIYSNDEQFGVENRSAPNPIIPALLAMKSYVGKDKAQTSYFVYDDQVYSSTVSRIQKTTGRATDRSPYLAVFRPLNKEFFDEISKNYGLPPIKLITDVSRFDRKSAPNIMIESDKKPIAYITWETKSTASDLLYILIPGSLIVLILVCGSGLILYRRILRASEGYTVLVEDLSESSELLERAEDREKEIQEDKTRFLSTMSHEMKTPMNGLMGMIALLKETELNDTQITYVNTMENATDSLIKLVDNILDFSKLESGEVSLSHGDVNIREIAAEVHGLLMPISLQKKLKFELFFGDNVPMIIRSDPVRIRQVFLHLVTNSLKFTKVGSVKINVTAVDLPDKQVEMGIQIIDTGIGIPDAIKDTLFADFCSVKDDEATKGKSGPITGHTSQNIGESGVGVGLNIVKNTVNLLQGKCGLESKLNQGSVFWVQFKAEIVKGAPKVSGKEKKEEFQPKSILIIDQDIDGMPYNLLQQSGNNLFSALDTDQALPIISQEKLDAVIINVPKEVSEKQINLLSPIRSALKDSDEIPIVAILDEGQETENLSQYDKIIYTPLTSGKLKAMLRELDNPSEE